MSVQFGGFSFFNFPALGGAPGRPWPVLSTEMEITSRPGADGIEVQSLGYKGTPFDAVSFVTVANLTAGHALFALYKAAEGTGIAWPLLDWHGINYSLIHGCSYIILRVELVGLQRYTCSAGGSILGAEFFGDGAGLRCQWTLVPVVSSRLDAIFG